MEKVPCDSTVNQLHFTVAASNGGYNTVNNFEALMPSDSTFLTCGSNGAGKDQMYEAVMQLSRSIAGRTDLPSLVEGLAGCLGRIVHFDHVGLILHDPNGNAMQGHIINEPGNPAIKTLRLPVDQDPAGWVWMHQQPLVVSPLQLESRWPEFLDRARRFGITTLVLVPLTAGENRLGALGISSVTPSSVTPAQIEFLQRVAGECAVAVESFLARQAVAHERDRLRTLCDITNALVSNLDRDALFAAISAQLSRVLDHDCARIALCNQSGGLDVYALHAAGSQCFEALKESYHPEGTPAGEVLAAGKPVVAQHTDTDRYPSQAFRQFVSLGFRSVCAVPLVARNHVIGVLSLNRMSAEAWLPDDSDFLFQIGRQIALTLENSFAYRELADLKDRLVTEKLYLEEEIRCDQNIGSMVGDGPAIQAVMKSIRTVAPTQASVLILGETGTGKELVARAIHELSGRRGSFVKVNCAAIPASLLESELFGHEKGSFTGAVAQKIGRFELAHEGTLFLDEIGEMPLELQPKLLRAIQDQEFERVGGNRTIRTNVRFVAATNRDLKSMVSENKFRADLYYRLHVFPVFVPPLRERREDIPLLTRYFVQKHARQMGRNIDTIPKVAMDAMMQYGWPGNIRELQNVVERSVILSDGNILQLAMPDVEQNAAAPPSIAPEKNGGTGERDRILKALEAASGQVGGATGAAALLGLKRTTLQSRMRKFNIARSYN